VVRVNACDVCGVCGVREHVCKCVNVCGVCEHVWCVRICVVCVNVCGVCLFHQLSILKGVEWVWPSVRCEMFHRELAPLGLCPTL